MKTTITLLGIAMLCLIACHSDDITQKYDSALYHIDTTTQFKPPLLNPDTMKVPQPMSEKEIELANQKSDNKFKNNSEAITPSTAPAGSSVVDAYMDPIYNKVAYDAEQQFFIAQREGDLMQIYVHAQMVAAAYLQAKDEVNYRKWQKIKRKYARKIGL